MNKLPQQVQTIYVKATMSAASSVLMAEAAALALAAIITEKIGLQRVNFLSDNQQLVNFLNAQDQTNPPEWRIKYYTQIFYNSTAPRNTRLYMIQTTQNQTTYTLARRAINHVQSPVSLGFICTDRKSVV